MPEIADRAMTPDHQELLRRAQTGDARAFGDLIDEHIPTIRRFARVFARSDADADDLAQEALIKVHEALDGYRGESAFSTWIFSIVRNAYLDTAKKRERRARLGEGIDAAQATSSWAADDALAFEEERRRLWRAIAALPIDYRTALVLVVIEGVSCAEVAAIEKISVGTVKSRVSRGRDELRRLLGAPARQADRERTTPTLGCTRVQGGI